MSLVKKIQHNIFRHRLFNRGSKIVVGVSGGPDSVCLLEILSQLQKKCGLRLVIAHVNYCLRGKDSDRDEKFVKALSEKYSLPLEIIRNTEYSPHSANLEEKLRKVRYAFFEKILKKHKADIVAVGHNLNDQAETVLIRLLRGSGLRGLASIKFKSRFIVRPLLNITRKEIIDYLRSKRIPYRIDKTNQGTDFFRNKIRNLLLPHLEKNFNSNIHNTLYNLSRSAAEDYEFIGSFAGNWLGMNDELQVPQIRNLHPAIRNEVLRQAIEKLHPGLREIESGHISEIVKIIESSKNKRQKITFKGLIIERKGDKLTIKKSAKGNLSTKSSRKKALTAREQFLGN